MSSTRLDFRVDRLRERIAQERDLAIQEAQDELDSKTVRLPALREAWRKDVVAKARRVVKHHAALDDQELKRAFELPDYPRGTEDRWGTRSDPTAAFNKAVGEAKVRHDRKIDRLEGLRTETVDGVEYLSITTSMLRDWFGL